MKLPKIPIANVDTKILLSGYEAIGHYHDIKYFVSFYRNSETGGEFWLDSCSRPVMLTHLSLMPEFVEVSDISTFELKRQVASEIVNRISVYISTHERLKSESRESYNNDYCKGFDQAYKNIKQVIESEESIFKKESD